MGRSRRRARAAGVPDPAVRVARPATVAPQVLRRSLGAYLAGAIVIAILVLIGTVALAPSWAPWAVLVADAAASFALFKWADARLAGLPLGDEDRVLQTLAGGLLAVVLLFAAVAAVVLTVA